MQDSVKPDQEPSQFQYALADPLNTLITVLINEISKDICKFSYLYIRQIS